VRIYRQTRRSKWSLFAVLQTHLKGIPLLSKSKNNLERKNLIAMRYDANSSRLVCSPFPGSRCTWSTYIKFRPVSCTLVHAFHTPPPPPHTVLMKYLMKNFSFDMLFLRICRLHDRLIFNHTDVLALNTASVLSTCTRQTHLFCGVLFLFSKSVRQWIRE
jgi:hypothetical protein